MVFLGISRGSGGDMKVLHPLVGLTVLSLVDNVASHPGSVSMLKTLVQLSYMEFLCPLLFIAAAEMTMHISIQGSLIATWKTDN